MQYDANCQLVQIFALLWKLANWKVWIQFLTFSYLWLKTLWIDVCGCNTATDECRRLYYVSHASVWTPLYLQNGWMLSRVELQVNLKGKQSMLAPYVCKCIQIRWSKIIAFISLLGALCEISVQSRPVHDHRCGLCGLWMVEEYVGCRRGGDSWPAVVWVLSNNLNVSPCC